MRLRDKVAIVTGGAGGIGAAIARRFVAEGARVVISDRDEGALRALAAELGEARVRVVVADVAEPAASAAMVAAAVDAFGGLDVMVANAGIEGVAAPIVEQRVEDLDRVLAVNVRGAFLAIQHAAPAIARRGGGAILVTSSVAGLVGGARLAPYVASKHAVMGLVKTAAVELAPLGIRVCAINPGPIENRMMRSIEQQVNPADADAVKHGYEGIVPMRRYGTNEEIASLALFLASDEASYCTGAAYVADGGLTAV